MHFDRPTLEQARHIGVQDANEALAIVSEYYPHSRVSPKTRFGIEEIFGGTSSDTGMPTRLDEP